MSTFTRAALPSTTRNTNCSSPCGTIACSGMTSASFSSRVIRFTRANMPGRSDVSALRTIARMTTERPAASISGLTASTLPSNVLPGSASSVTVSVWPDLHLPHVDLGHAEVDLQRIDRLEVDHVGALLHVVADRHDAQADDAGERRLDLGLGEPRLGQRDRGLGDAQVVLGLVLRLARDEVALRQVDGAIVLALARA